VPDYIHDPSRTPFDKKILIIQKDVQANINKARPMAALTSIIGKPESNMGKYIGTVILIKLAF